MTSVNISNSNNSNSVLKEIDEIKDQKKASNNNFSIATFIKKKFLLFAISSLLLYLLIKDVNVKEIIGVIKSANLIFLIFAFSLHAIGLTISAFRWKLLLQSLQINSKIFYLVKSYLVASFFNNFIPSTIGGDSIRVYDSYKLGKSKSKGFVVVFVDRFLGLFALVIFTFIASFYSFGIISKMSNINIWIIASLLISFIIILFILFPPLKFFNRLKNSRISILNKAGSLLYKIGEAFSQFRNRKPALLKALMLSVFLQINVILYYYLISLSLGFNIPIISFSFIVPLLIFILMVPISINGIGLRENALFFFFSFYGIPKTEAIAFAWIEFSMLLLLGIIGGIVYAFRK